MIFHHDRCRELKHFTVFFYKRHEADVLDLVKNNCVHVSEHFGALQVVEKVNFQQTY